MEWADNLSVPIEPPSFRGDSADDGLSFPSIPSSDNSLEEFFSDPLRYRAKQNYRREKERKTLSALLNIQVL